MEFNFGAQLDNVCISHSNDAQSVLNLVAGLTSTKEQLEKSNRIQTKRVIKALRGEYLGGIPPYGLDVVCKTPRWTTSVSLRSGGAGEHGQAKAQWKTHLQGETRGLKVTETDPIGEPCDGIPVHEKGDTLFLAPTIRQDRIDTIQRIFMLMDTETTNPTQISASSTRRGSLPSLERSGPTQKFVRC